MTRWGWIDPVTGQPLPDTFETAAEAIIEMGLRICPDLKRELDIVERAARVGFRLAVVRVSMSIELIVSEFQSVK